MTRRGAFAPVMSTAPHHHIRLTDEFPQQRRGRHEREAVGGHDVTQIAQPVEIHVENVDLGPETAGHLGGIGADHAAADDDHRAGVDTGHAAQQHAVPALCHLKVLGPLLDGHAPGDLAHGSQQRQGAVGLLDGLVRDAHGAGVHECPGEFLVGRKMQVGEDHLPLADERILRRLRFLDVHHHVGTPINLCRGGNQGRPRSHIGLVHEAAACPRTGLDQYGVPVVAKHLNPGRGHGDTILFRFDFLEDTDDHAVPP